MNVLITSASRKVWLVRAFQRALQAEGGGSVVAVDASPYAAALHAADTGCVVPRGLDERFFKSVLEISKIHRVGLLVPTRDEELAAFARCRAKFAAAGIAVMVSDEEVVRRCQDKLVFASHCLEHGFQVPKIVEQGSGDLNFPVFVRARVGKAGRSAFRVDSLDELSSVLSKLQNPIVQEFVDADEYTVDVFVAYDGRVLSAVPRLRMATFGGESFVGKTVKHATIVDETVKLVASLGLVGFATVQCFWHQGKVKFIEINPRIGGGANLSIAAGADTPRMALRVAADKPVMDTRDAFKDGLVMLRYTEDMFLDGEELHVAFDR